ncbi:MAG TPA: 2-phospho-L-lactate transferase CofD family protein [Candidatus Saccharimonadales bacterium]|nr:2-phospho-L-lactate transferase CofD family protein [Candidatus Saccharimonadales bacterium]
MALKQGVSPGAIGQLPRKIVVIGGGTGGSTVVRALNQPPFMEAQVTAIATTFDDGGGTGELRNVYRDLPAVGDMRQCFEAMSALSPQVLSALRSRFGGGDLVSDRLNIEGQAVGNLIIARIMQDELAHGGTFGSALRMAGELFQAKGMVVPPSNDIRRLVFDLPDGTRIIGEHAAEVTTLASLRGTRIAFLDGHPDLGDAAAVQAAIRPAVISAEADEAIRSADVVLLAPGDLYTSLGPNLRVDGMPEALQAAGTVVMVSNLMNRDRHTVGYTTKDYVDEYERIIGMRVIRQVLYNTVPLDPSAVAAQRRTGSQPVLSDMEGLTAAGYEARGFDLLSHEPVQIDFKNDQLAGLRSQIRHDPAKLAAAIRAMYLPDDETSASA